ncbi:DUF3987 domain-containing protein [Cerasicoccus frondis]|uniref:DUF3987 domain-containing protein n=1 Tax=Cerasicoccus frondis TaxID=490090 RepID=UPI0028524E39|nr:DUF3987 domain-containing protein [Cerasicoccus frondis]
MSTFLDHALNYSDRNWPVFPLTPGGKEPLIPKAKGGNGCLDATTDTMVIRRWWNNEPQANIGLACGKVSGFFVLDVDGEQGSRSLTALESEIGPLPETLEQTTGTGGRHLLFKYPEGRKVGNRIGFRPKLDIRADGGYIVMAPSIHPDTKQAYRWPYGENTPLAEAPVKLLDIIAPKPKRIAPWEQPPKPKRSDFTPSGDKIKDRARLYLQECEPAVQGQGGHDKLLWAARSLVIGFELDDGTALTLLWGEYNPRCVPAWDRSDPKDVRDFERKVIQARETGCLKPRGWLLDEYDLRDGDAALAALGRQSAENLLQAAYTIQDESVAPTSEEGEFNFEYQPFPIELLPDPIHQYAVELAKSMVVDVSAIGLPLLCVAGGAMGNAWAIQLKKGWIERPCIWVGLVAPSGSNKSAPLRELLAPLEEAVPLGDIDKPMLNPQNPMVVRDATMEAVVQRLQESKRGLFSFRDELAGWLGSFNQYKKGGGDEAAWLEFWGGGTYRVDRKTQDQPTIIHNALVSVLGGIQPKVMARLLTPEQFDSGFVPRTLVACPPTRRSYWSEDEVSEESKLVWRDTVQWLKSRPFAQLDTNTGIYSPNVIELKGNAKQAFIAYVNENGEEMESAKDTPRAFMSKSTTAAARLALIHCGLSANFSGKQMPSEIPLESMQAGVAWARWSLREQLRVFGFAKTQTKDDMINDILQAVESYGGKVTSRKLQQNGFPRKFGMPVDAKHCKQLMGMLVSAGKAQWNSKTEIQLI